MPITQIKIYAQTAYTTHANHLICHRILITCYSFKNALKSRVAQNYSLRSNIGKLKLLSYILWSWAAQLACYRARFSFSSLFFFYFSPTCSSAQISNHYLNISFYKRHCIFHAFRFLGFAVFIVVVPVHFNYFCAFLSNSNYELWKCARVIHIKLKLMSANCKKNNKPDPAKSPYSSI